MPAPPEPRSPTTKITRRRREPQPATHVSIDRVDLSTAAFWLGQLARWLDDPNHASQFSWDLFDLPEDYRPPLTVVIASTMETTPTMPAMVTSQR